MNTDKIYAESIAKEYAAKEERKVVALRKLDAKAKTPSRIFGLCLGVISSLVLGVGMCLAMNVIGDGSAVTVGVGVGVGVVGILGMCVNYPIYKKIWEKSKRKYAQDVIRLAKEISGEQ